MYCSLDDLKDELGDQGFTADDGFLGSKIVAAQAFIEAYTGRVFEVGADTTRLYSIDDTDGRDLLLDETLAAPPTTVKTYADAVSPAVAVTVPVADYVTMPRNRAPYWGIRILGSSPYYWRYAKYAEKAIEITGKFAYSLTAPEDIKQACIRLAGFFYRQKDASVYDVTASAETGQMVIPKGTPQDVVKILMNRRKPTL